jgi:hypothetical protein
MALLVLSKFLLSSVNADTLEFEMPGLVGGSDTTRTDSFVYNGQSATINRVYVRFQGYIHDLGLIYCTAPPGHEYESGYFDVGGTIRAGGKTWNNGTDYLGQSGPFDQTGRYYNYSGSGNISKGNVIEMVMFFEWTEGDPNPYCWMVRRGYGEMHTVTIIFDVTYGVPVKPSTWGCIKDLYE